MAIDKTEGVIINRIDFRETSILATFFTKDFGKLKGLLKGARADINKFGSRVEPFTNNEIVFYRKTKGEIHLVSQCDLKDYFLAIHKDLDKINLAGYVAKLIDAIMPSEDKNEAVFNLLLDFLKSLNENSDLEQMEKVIEIKLLSLSGFKPHLDDCIVCAGKIKNNAHFSLKLGGLICGGCFSEDKNATPVSSGTVASLLHLEKGSWNQTRRLKLSQLINKELGIILKKFLSYHIDIKLNFSDNKEVSLKEALK